MPLISSEEISALRIALLIQKAISDHISWSSMRDPHYLAAFIQNRGAIRGNDEYGKLAAQGLSNSTARALELFQLSGCYTAATNVATEEEWNNARAAIDEFIRGGLSAVRARLAEGKLA